MYRMRNKINFSEEPHIKQITLKINQHIQTKLPSEINSSVISEKE